MSRRELDRVRVIERVARGELSQVEAPGVQAKRTPGTSLIAQISPTR
jgi:hypothetical protein